MAQRRLTGLIAPRLPLRGLGEEQHEEMRAELRRIGFFDHCCRPGSP